MSPDAAIVEVPEAAPGTAPEVAPEAPVVEAPAAPVTDEVTPSPEALRAVRRRRAAESGEAAPETAPQAETPAAAPADAPAAPETAVDAPVTPEAPVSPDAPVAPAAEAPAAPVADPALAAEQSGIAAPADDLGSADAAIAEAEAALAEAEAAGEGEAVARARLRAAEFDRQTLSDPFGTAGGAAIDPLAPAPGVETAPGAAPADAVDPLAAASGATSPAEPQAPRVLPDQLTAEQRELLATREELRREQRRRQRAELIGVAAAGLAIGAIVPQLGGRVVEDTGDRVVVQDGDEYFIVRDENELLRDRATDVIRRDLGGGLIETSFVYPDGSEVLTVRDAGGTVLKRSRVRPDGTEVVLFDDTRFPQAPVAVDYDLELGPVAVPIPRERYIVEASRVDADFLIQTFEAPAVETVEQAYTLADVRRSERLREKVRRVDLDAITFDTGSAAVRRAQLPFLDEVGIAMSAAVADEPDAVFLVEGHTDAVGSEVSNLTLSDRRAETVAALLTERYGVPPENLVVEGYGERYLKVPTEAAERANRRVTVRNITPLLSASAQ